MISIHQCRAARGLLGWTQADLANASGLSKTAINNFERGLSAMKNESLMLIRRAIEQEGLNFTAYDGVERSHDRVFTLHGWEDIENTCIDALSRDESPLLCVTHIDKDKPILPLRNLLENLSLHFDKNLRARVIGNNEYQKSPDLQGLSYLEYRWISNLIMPFTPVQILLPSILITSYWDSDRFLAIQQQSYTQMEMVRYNTLWQSANLP